MNWQTINFDWNQVRAFLVTAEEGSFSAAARALDATQPTIGRQISGLESNLGLTLFERTVRGPILTEAGRDLIEHVRAMGDAASLISMVATSKSQTVSGKVSITATDLMASALLPDILLSLRKSAPEIRIELVATNDIQNLSLREADIAIRHVRPEQAELIGRHLGDFRANYYASTGYLDQQGRPKSANDLFEHQFVGGSDLNQMLMLLQNSGVQHVRPENFVITSNNGAAMWELAKAGMGITLLPEALGDKESSLERAVPDMPSIEFPVWLVTHSELRTTPRIRVVFDALARGLNEMAAEQK